MKNSYENSYENMVIFSINNFSSYNKKYGWEKGDILLKEFANTLAIHFEDDLVFRIFGDDFVIISKNEILLNGVLKVLDTLMNKDIISYKIDSVNLLKDKIDKLTDIEMIQAK